MLKQSELKLPKRKIVHLFGISKMTVVEDTSEKGVKELEHMRIVELLEFIGRLAIIKFLGTELENEPLATKISYILDELFAPIGLVKEDPISSVEVETTSESEDF